ncbi:MAG: Ppx/GppA phosphatase family protein [Acidobacteriota bacterium]
MKERYGIVDIGSNTIRLVVFTPREGGGFRLLDELRTRARLGEGLGQDGNITPAAMDRAFEVLRHIADYTRGARLDGLEVIGTSALRDAGNASEFLERVEELGLTVRVLPGEVEAKLGVLAVANGFRYRDAWVLDLGGGSAQISRMEGRRMVDGAAYPLGAVRLSEAFLHSDPPTADEIEALEAMIAHELGDVAKAMRERPDPLVMMGGTSRNLARAVQKADAYPLDLLHGFFMSSERLGSLTDQLLTSTTRERAGIRGIHPDRADIIVAGAVVLRWLLAASGQKGFVLSGYGVREGAYFRHVLEPPHLIHDVAAASIIGAMSLHVGDRAHAAHVRRLARLLFDGLRPIHELDDRDADILDAAAALHGVGLSVHYYRQQKHGMHLLTAGPLDGHDHREQALIALLVRYQHKEAPKLSPLKEVMGRGDKRRLLMLSGCLRLADALDRSRAGRVRDLHIKAGKKTIHLGVEVDDPTAVELWDASTHAEYIERVFQRRLKIEAVTPNT